MLNHLLLSSSNRKIMEKKYKSFAEFYPYYLTEHSKSSTRTLHYIGTSLFFILLFTGIVRGQWYYFALLPVIGYGFAWIGHFFFEKNKPATFTYPLWSLCSDFKMYFDWLSGRLADQLKSAQTIQK